MKNESLVAALLEPEGYAAFEYLGEKLFRVIGISPAFCRELIAGSETTESGVRLAHSMPFLDNFLVDAESFWNSGAEGRVESGRWIEVTKAGGEIALEASAFREAGKRILLIRNPQQRHEDEVQAFQRARDSAQEKPLRILLAEDNPVNRELMVLMLERRGHQVTAVEDGQDVLRELENWRPDILIMDEEMPRMSGLSATRAIREKEKSTGEHIPIITVTGNATEADQLRGMEAGVDAFLAKPIDVKELFQRMGELSGGVVASAQAVRESARTATTTTTGETAAISAASDESELLKRVGGNAKVLRDLARIFLTDTPKRMKVIRAAIQTQNAPAVASTAHSLKGSAGIFGAKEIVEQARTLEMLGRSGKLAGADEIFASLESKIAVFEAVLSKITAEAAKKKRSAGARRDKKK